MRPVHACCQIAAAETSARNPCPASGRDTRSRTSAGAMRVAFRAPAEDDGAESDWDRNRKRANLRNELYAAAIKDTRYGARTRTRLFVPKWKGHPRRDHGRYLGLQV